MMLVLLTATAREKVKRGLSVMARFYSATPSPRAREEGKKRAHFLSFAVSA